MCCALLTIALSFALAQTGPRKDYMRIAASFDEQARELHVVQRIDYNNRSDQRLDEIVLNAYPNAYKEQSRAPVPKNEMKRAYPSGWNGGGLSMQSVLLNGQRQDYEMEGGQMQLMRLPLKESLPRHGSCDLTLEYTVKIPENALRMGLSDHDVRLGNCFFTPAVFTEDGLLLDDYSPVGDPFVSHVADYHVDLTLPQSYVAAGTGLISIDDGVWHFKANNVREMAFVLSKDYEVCQSEQDGVTLRSFAFTREGAKEAMGYAQKALSVFGDLFGKYPYNDFSVCASKFYVGGMEYPGLVMIDETIYDADDGMLEFVTVHEVAHQWWYAGVGSDQVRHPWQDEALAEYSTLLYYETVYGAQSFDSMYQTLIRPATESPALRGVGLDQPLMHFSTPTTYDALIYRKGAAMLHDLRTVMGNEGFLSALRTYYKRNLFGLAMPDDFLSSLGGTAAQRAMEWLTGSA